MDPQYWSFGRSAGLFLILGVVAVFVGIMMFWIRGGVRGGLPPTRAYFVWERGSIMAGAVLTAVAFMLLEGQLQNSNGRILARTGATSYLFAAILGVAAEALVLSQKEGDSEPYPLIVAYVVVAFLAQTAIGGALLQSGLLASWIGWSMVVWNLVWLAILSVFSRRDMYYPVLHHFMPLVIGIALLGLAA